MADDHFVAQTYLRHFVGPSGMLRAYRKSNGCSFPCRPRDICHEPNGDVIPDFLNDPHYLAKYRGTFEPGWNSAVAALKARSPDFATKFYIAGYWAQLMVCTPSWKRVAIEISNQNAIAVSDSLCRSRSIPCYSSARGLIHVQGTHRRLVGKPGPDPRKHGQLRRRNGQGYCRKVQNAIPGNVRGLQAPLRCACCSSGPAVPLCRLFGHTHRQLSNEGSLAVAVSHIGYRTRSRLSCRASKGLGYYKHCAPATWMRQWRPSVARSRPNYPSQGERVADQRRSVCTLRDAEE